MRRYFFTKGFPWSRGETRQSERSPLLPKSQSAKNEEEQDNAQTPTGAKTDQDHRTPTKLQPFYGYSLTDYFLKYFLFLFNFVFTVFGLTVLGLGMWGLVAKESFAQERIGSIGADPMLVLVSLGLLLPLLCLTGCVGALRENCCLLRFFSAVVLTLIAAQVLIAILAYSMQERLTASMRSVMLTAMEGYQDDPDLRFIADEIQTSLQCCGVDTYRDWEVNVYYNCSSPGVLACGVPATCCVDPLENGTVWNSQCGVGAQLLDEFTAQSTIFLGGCLGQISRWVEQHEGLVGTIAVVIIGVQILAVFLTTRLLESINWHKMHSHRGADPPTGR